MKRIGLLLDLHNYQTPMTENRKENKGMCHNVALPFTLKSILRQKKNYENSNISPYKNPLVKKTKILQDIIITLL
jgi:hypothetical protein